MNYNGQRVMIGLSGGINSMAVLCWLANYEQKPKEVYLFYAHLVEHSPDTFDFVLAGVEYAEKHFEKVHFEYTTNSVLEFFRQQNMIPHPMFAPCTRVLKSIPMAQFSARHNITVDLVGYVRHEKRRVKGMQRNAPDTLFHTKHFPIQLLTDEDCFEMVDKEIGWHPAIYDILEANGKRVFKHNNCLPCKNMQIEDMQNVEEHYPVYHGNAMRLSEDLKYHWGRNADEFYTTFGRHDYETGFEKQPCEVCSFD